MPRIVLPCCWCFRRWTRPARTAPSGRCSTGSIPMACTWPPSRPPPTRRLSTISCGEPPKNCPAAAASACLTAATTKRCWWCGFTLSSWAARTCRPGTAWTPCGSSATKPSASMSCTWPSPAPWSSSSGSSTPGRSSASASWIASPNPKNTGSFPSATWPSAATGTSTCSATRTRSTPPHAPGPRGT